MVKIDISDLDIKNLGICGMDPKFTLMNAITSDTENNFKSFKLHLFSTKPDYTKIVIFKKVFHTSQYIQY